MIDTVFARQLIRPMMFAAVFGAVTAPRVALAIAVLAIAISVYAARTARSASSTLKTALTQQRIGIDAVSDEAKALKPDPTDNT